MLKLTLAVLAVALAGTASAAGWRSLRVDASSEAAFEQSLAVFKEKLSPARRQVFGEALKDIWVKGSQEAAAEQREYTIADYYRQIGGLGYKQVVNFTDPSGDTAQARLRQASRSLYTAGRPPVPYQREGLGETPSSALRDSTVNQRGRTPLGGPGGQQ
jgi:hypothetical protein